MKPFGGEKQGRRPVARITAQPHRNARGRRIVVTLEAGDLIGLRPERTRRVEYVPAGAIYDLAVKMRVLAERRAKKGGK